MNKIWLFLSLISFLFGVKSLTGQDAAEDSFLTKLKPVAIGNGQSLMDNFEGNQIVEMRLLTDLKKLKKNVKTNDYQDAICSLVLANGQKIEQGIKIRPRGKTRRKICEMPPIKMKFDKSDLKDAGYAPYKTFKLVPHCMDEKDADQYVLKEYLAYKMYNELSDYSLRVQLVKITYEDINDRGYLDERYGFLIESEKEFRERFEIKTVERFAFKFADFEKQQAEIFSVFQYMIGNADWQLFTKHNLKIFQKEGANKFIIVPYDFDYSGLVNNAYALPNPDYHQKSVRDRVYIGTDAPLSEETMELFLSKKTTFENLINNMEFLSKRHRKESLRFLDSFYKVLQNPAKRKEIFQNIK